MSLRRYTTIVTYEDITPQIFEAAESIYDGWFSMEPKIDWTDFLDRLDGLELENGTRADLGNNMTSPAIKAIKKHINTYRKG